VYLNDAGVYGAGDQIEVTRNKVRGYSVTYELDISSGGLRLHSLEQYVAAPTGRR